MSREVRSRLDAYGLVKRNGTLTNAEFADYLIFVKNYDAFGVLTNKGTEVFLRDKRKLVAELEKEIKNDQEDNATCSPGEGCHGKYYKKLHSCSSCQSDWSCREKYAKRIGVNHWDLD